MEIVPIVLDTRPSYLQDFAPTMSLLSMPAGTGTVLSELLSSIPHTGAQEVRILPTFTPTPEYERFVVQEAPPGTEVVTSDVLKLLMQEHESSDYLLVLDPRYWPVDGLDLSHITRQGVESRWAAHGVAVGSAGETPESTSIVTTAAGSGGSAATTIRSPT